MLESMLITMTSGDTDIPAEIRRIMELSIPHKMSDPLSKAKSTTKWFKVDMGVPFSPNDWMVGSPWGLPVQELSLMSRVVQHTVPSLEKFNTLIASGTEIYIYGDFNTGMNGYSALLRNGYKSNAQNRAYSYWWFMEAVYFDPEEDSWMYVNTNKKQEAIPFTDEMKLRG